MKKLLVANLKMNIVSADQRDLYIAGIESRCSDMMACTDVVICPSTIDIYAFEKLGTCGVHIGAQDLAWKEKGAFTGETSPLRLYEYGVRYTIVGHSERRLYYGESDAMIGEKVESAIRNNITPIICVGESAEARRGDHPFEHVREQIIASVSALRSGSELTNLIFAYEPIWAISTNHTVNDPQITANDILSAKVEIMKTLTEIYDRTFASQVRILYGGSVNVENAHEVCIVPEMDGVLVGGASCDPGKFATIAQQLKN